MLVENIHEPHLKPRRGDIEYTVDGITNSAKIVMANARFVIVQYSFFIFH